MACKYFRLSSNTCTVAECLGSTHTHTVDFRTASSCVVFHHVKCEFSLACSATVVAVSASELNTKRCE